MSEETSYQAFCNRVCSYAMSYELGIPFQWDTPLPRIGYGRRGEGVQEDLRLTVVHRHVHYYQRTSTGEEYEIQPQGQLWWLPSVPEHVCPPATEEQLQATENLLGFRLTPSFRALYEQVANGGFGPGYDGIFGAFGSENREISLLTNQYRYQKKDRKSIDLAVCQRRVMTQNDSFPKYIADWEIVIPPGYWADRLLPITQDGCDLGAFLSIPTDQIFYRSGDFAYRLIANSLEAFFERWMRDDLYPPSSPRTGGTYYPFDDPL